MRIRPVFLTLTAGLMITAGIAQGDNALPKPQPILKMAVEPKPLFNGKDFTGFTQKGGKAEYKVENGEMVGISKKGTPNSFMCTDKMYSNFVLEYEFKVNPNLNSGVQIRSNYYEEEKVYNYKTDMGEKTIKVKPKIVHGYQVEIDPSPRSYTCGIYDESRRGWLCDLKDNEKARKAFKPNEWNKVRIQCEGDSIKTWINDVLAADIHDDMTSTGFIGFQVHSAKEEGMEIRWRNINIAELPN